MITEVENHPMESTASIMGSIVDDLRDLLKQELRLAKEEMKEDLRKAREASMYWAVGVGSVWLSVVPFIFMVVNLLHTLTSPAGSDPASLPLWACFGIVGTLLAIVGVSVMSAGQKRFDSVSNLVDHQIRQVTKEVSNGRQS